MLPLSLQEGWPVDSTMKLIETWKGKGYMQLCPFRDHVHPFPWEKQVKPMPWVHIFMVFNGICVERHDCRNELIYHGNNVLDRINVKKKCIFWEMLTEEMLTEEMLSINLTLLH